MKAKIIILSTDKKAKVGDIVQRPSDGKLAVVNVLTVDDPQPCVTQYLYFITDDEVEEGWSGWAYKPDANPQIFKHFYTTNPCTKDAKKIIATTDSKLNLPQPSQEFIKQYCKAGGIDEVLIEMERVGGIGIRGDFKTSQIKVNNSNEITIHPIKNSWSRKEVEGLLNRLSISLYSDRDAEDVKRKLFMNNWIKENL